MSKPIYLSIVKKYYFSHEIPWLNDNQINYSSFWKRLTLQFLLPLHTIGKLYFSKYYFFIFTSNPPPRQHIHRIIKPGNYPIHPCIVTHAKPPRPIFFCPDSASLSLHHHLVVHTSSRLFILSIVLYPTPFFDYTSLSHSFPYPLTSQSLSFPLYVYIYSASSHPLSAPFRVPGATSSRFLQQFVCVRSMRSSLGPRRRARVYTARLAPTAQSMILIVSLPVYLKREERKERHMCLR